MFSTCPFYFQVFQSHYQSFGDCPNAPITIGIAVAFMFIIIIIIIIQDLWPSYTEITGYRQTSEVKHQWTLSIFSR